MIYDFNKTYTMYERLKESSKNRKDSVAIDYYGNKISYGDLLKNIDDIAYGFKEKRGIKKGDRVAFCVVN